MNINYIPAIIMLLAGLIDCVISIYNRLDMLSFSKRLLFVLVIFYILGIGVKFIINKIFPIETEVAQNEEESLVEDEENQSDSLENIDTDAVEENQETGTDFDDF